MRRILISLLMLAVGIGVSWADGRTISVNFNSGQGSVTDGTAAGLVSDSHWNNISTTSGSGQSLTMSDGTSSGASMTWTCGGNYQWTSATDAFLKGYLDDNGNGISITISNIPFTTYKVIIYQATDTKSYAFNPPSINGVYYSYDGTKTSTTKNDTNLKYGASQNTTAVVGTNTISFDHNFTGTLSILGAGNTNSARGCIAAIQIVETEGNIYTVAADATTKLSEITNLSSYDGINVLGTLNVDDTYDLTKVTGTGTVNLTTSDSYTIPSAPTYTLNIGENASVTVLGVIPTGTTDISKITGSGLMNLTLTGDLSNSGGGSGTRSILTSPNFAGTMVVKSGLLSVESSLNANAKVKLDGGGIVFNAMNTTFNNAVEIGSTGYLRAYGSEGENATRVLSGTLSGSGTLKKTDGGTIKVSGTNNFTGTVVIGKGYLQFASNASITDVQGNSTDKNRFVVANNAIVNIGTAQTTISAATTKTIGDASTYNYDVTSGAKIVDNRYLNINKSTVNVRGEGEVDLFGLCMSRADVSSSASTINVAANTTFHITGTEASTTGGSGAFMLSNWPAANTINIDGWVICDTKFSNRDGTPIININDGGKLTMSIGLGIETQKSVTVNVKNGGELIVGGNNTGTSSNLVVNMQDGSTLKSCKGGTTSGQALTIADGASITIDADNKTLTTSSALATTGTITTKGTVTLTGVISGEAGNVVVNSGTTTFSGTNTYTGDLTIKSGATAKSTTTLGFGPASSTRLIVVEDGGAVDLANTTNATYYYKIAGTGVDNSGAMYNSGSAIGNGSMQTTSITLTADATISCAANWGLLGSGYGATTLKLAGHTLTKKGTANFWLCNVSDDDTAGKIIVSEGAIYCYKNASNLSSYDVEFAGGSITADVAVSFNNIILDDNESLTYVGSKVTSSAITANGDATINLGEASTNLSQEITVGDGKTLTFNKADGLDAATVTFSGTLSGTGTITAADGVTISLLKLRSMAYNFGSAVQFTETDEEYGKGGFTVTNIPSNITSITVVKYEDNTTTTVDVTDGSATYSHDKYVSGKAAWLDYTFNTETLTGHLTQATTASGRVINNAGNAGSSVTLQLDGSWNETNSYNETTGGLYGKTQPYRRMEDTYAWPDKYSVAVYSNVPDVEDCCLMTFGSTTSGTKNWISILRGDENEIKLVSGTGNAAYTKIQTMSAQNAAVKKHLVVFTKDGSKFTIYLDGTKVATTTYSETLGGGFQVGSIHGGVTSTGVGRIDAQSETIQNAVEVGAIRVYDYVLSDAQQTDLATEFPYEGAGGTYSRTFSGDENLSSTNAWKDADAATCDLPTAKTDDDISYDPDVNITATADSKITVNAAAQFSKLTFTSSENKTVTLVSDGTNKITVTGSTVINTPVVMKYNAMKITDTPVTIGENGSLTVDYTDYDFSGVYESTSIKVTGITDKNDSKVQVTTPTTYAHRKYTLAYNETDQCYWLTIAPDRTAGTVYLPSGTTDITDGVEVSTTSGGEANSILLSGDNLVIENAGTYKFNETVSISATINVGSSDIVKVINNSNSKTLNGETINITSGTLQLYNGGGNDDPVIESATINIGENGNLDNFGWMTINGTLTITSNAKKTIFKNNNYQNKAVIQGSGKLVIPANVTVDAYVKASMTVSGAGSITLHEFPTSTTSHVNSWTGTVTFPATLDDKGDIAAIINNWGNADSKVILNSVGTSGSKGSGSGTYLTNNGTITPTIEIADGATVYINNGYGSSANTITKLMGAGNLVFDWTGGTPTCTITKADGFTGSISTADAGITVTELALADETALAAGTKLLSTTTSNNGSVTLTKVTIGGTEQTFTQETKTDGIYVKSPAKQSEESTEEVSVIEGKVTSASDVTSVISEGAQSIDMSNATTTATVDKAFVQAITTKTGNANTLVYVDASATLGTDDDAPNNVIKNGTCTSLVLTDGLGALNVPTAFTATTASYERTGSSTLKWGTVCLPYAPATENSGITYYELISDDSNNGVLKFQAVSEPQANVPYLYKNSNFAAEGGSNYSASASSASIVVTPTDLTPETKATYWMVGVLKPSSISDGVSEGYTGAADNYPNLITDAKALYIKSGSFWKINKRFTLKPFRAYITTNSENARFSTMSIEAQDDTPTGVEFIESEDGNSVDVIYDINGARLQQMKKGINIVNGKKVVK